MDNQQLCNEVTEGVVQHFVRMIETHGRYVEYLQFLQTIVKAEDSYIRKTQDMVMAEVGITQTCFFVFLTVCSYNTMISLSLVAGQCWRGCTPVLQ